MDRADLRDETCARLPASMPSGWAEPLGLAEGSASSMGLAGQLTYILNGHAYINFDTLQFSGGEARGMLAVVPEPSTLVLFGLGRGKCAAACRPCSARQRQN